MVRKYIDHVFRDVLEGMAYQERMKFYALCNCFFSAALCILYVTVFRTIQQGCGIITIGMLAAMLSCLLSAFALRKFKNINVFLIWNLINGYAIAVFHNITGYGFIGTGGTYIWAVLIIIVSIIYYNDKVARMFFAVYIVGVLLLLAYELLFQKEPPPQTQREQLFLLSFNILGIGLLIYSTFSIFVQDLIHNLTIANREAERLASVKSNFLSQMSHEIRTPLNAIIGMTQVARKRGETANIEETLTKIEGSSQHLLGIINDILDFSKMDSNQLELAQDEFHLQNTLEFLISMFNAQALDKGVTFSTQIGEIENGMITTDSLRLNQVLINLLSNALKFTPKGGTVRLQIEETSRNGYLSTFTFSVTDTGIGMSQADIDRLFSPFMQANASITRAYGGTGLGLAISQNITRLMGSRIEVSSVLGEGSSFSFQITVPARKAEAGSVADAIIPEQLRLRGRVLVVDDVPINREIILALLEDTGLMFDEAQNGREAVELYTRQPAGHYAMILMDVQMPVMDGLTATQHIRESGKKDATNIPIVALTANVIGDDVQRMLDAGMNAHLGKPIELPALLGCLQQYLPQAGT